MVDTDNISCLLSSLWHRSYSCPQWITNAVFSSCMGTNTISVYVKLDLKPASLLLEDKGNKASSDRHAQTVFLFLDVAATLNVKLV